MFGLVPQNLLEQEKEKSKKLTQVLVDASVELKVSADMIKIWIAGDVDDEIREMITNDYLNKMLAMNAKILDCLGWCDQSNI